MTPTRSQSRATQRKPEWVRQAWLYHFAEAVLLPPFEVRCIDHAGAAMANIATRQMASGRGLKPGTSDMLLWQGPEAVRVMAGLEVKHETSERPAQEAFAKALERCGFHVIRECRTTAQALAGLRAAGFRLHGNAENLACEYQQRIEAGLRELALVKSGVVKRKKAAPRTPKASPRQIRRAHAAGWWRAPA